MDKKTPHENKGNKGLADRMLFFCTVIFIISTAALIKYEDVFTFIIIQSLAAAAIVGGVADWYGVVSIYGRPIGISYKTEIVINKRFELLGGIKSFICSDILSKENIVNKLKEYPFASKILVLLAHKKNEDGPFHWLTNFLVAIIYEIVKKSDEKQAAININAMLRRVASRTSPSEEFIRIARWTLANNYDDKVFDAVAPGLIKVVKNDGFQGVVNGFIDKFHGKYMGSSWFREKFGDFRGEIKGAVYKMTEDFLKEINSDKQHDVRRNIKKTLRDALLLLEKDKKMQESIDIWISGLFDGDGIVGAVEDALVNLKKSNFNQGNCRELISSLLDKIIENLNKNESAHRAVNEWLIVKIANLVESNHDKIGSLVDASLNDMSDNDLVAFMREGTENDLQLIRVNGMCFGIFVGAIVIGLRYCVGRFL